MKTVIVKLSDVLRDNPSLCLSPLRACEDCVHCKIFRRALAKHNDDIHETLNTLECKPKIKANLIELFERRKELLEELRELRHDLWGEK